MKPAPFGMRVSQMGLVPNALESIRSFFYIERKMEKHEVIFFH